MEEVCNNDSKCKIICCKNKINSKEEDDLKDFIKESRLKKLKNLIEEVDNRIYKKTVKQIIE